MTRRFSTHTKMFSSLVCVFSLDFFFCHIFRCLFIYKNEYKNSVLDNNFWPKQYWLQLNSDCMGLIWTQSIRFNFFLLWSLCIVILVISNLLLFETVQCFYYMHFLWWNTEHLIGPRSFKEEADWSYPSTKRNNSATKEEVEVHL